MNKDGHWHGTIVRITTIILLSFGIVSCKTVEPIYVYETKTVYQDRYIPIPESLTNPVEIVELSETFDAYELGAAYKAQKIRAMQCNGRLAEIARIGE